MLPDLPRRYAIIPTHNRPVELACCIDAIQHQVHKIIIIDNASTPPVQQESYAPKCHVIYDAMQPPNLSRLWNFGLDYAFTDAAGQHHDVAILNDDAIVPTGWFTELSSQMRRWNTSGAYSGSMHGTLEVYHAGMPSIGMRVTGWAFMLRGESAQKFDERFVWWCGDDDMSMQLRQNGGLLHVPGFPVENTLANSTTHGVLAEQAAKDMQTFVDKWGVRPW